MWYLGICVGYKTFFSLLIDHRTVEKIPRTENPS
jgi:hypothetical protein